MGCSQHSQTLEKSEKNDKKRISRTHNTDIRKNYEFISMLGNGNFGKVRLYRDRKQKAYPRQLVSSLVLAQIQ